MKKLTLLVRLCMASLVASCLIDFQPKVGSIIGSILGLIIGLLILQKLLAFKNWARRIHVLFALLMIVNLLIAIFGSNNGIFFSGPFALVLLKKAIDIVQTVLYFGLALHLQEPDIRQLYTRDSKVKMGLIYSLTALSIIVGSLIIFGTWKWDSNFIREKNGRIIFKQSGEVLMDRKTPRKVLAEQSLSLSLPTPPYASGGIDYSKGHISTLEYIEPIHMTVLLVRNHSSEEIEINDVLKEKDKRLQLIESLTPGIFISSPSKSDGWQSIKPQKIGEKQISMSGRKINVDLMKTRDGLDAYQASFQLKESKYFVFAYVSLMSTLEQEKKPESEPLFLEFLTRLFDLNGN